MKQNASETESSWHFRKNLKACLQSKKSYLMPPSRHRHFHPILILPVKMVKLLEPDANTTVLWLQTLPLPIVAMSSILNVAEFLDPSLKTFPCTKTSPARVKTSLFSYYFAMWLPLSKVIVFFCYFLQYNETVFDQPVRRLLPLPCFYGSSQWLLKVKIICKRVNFVKK